MYYNNFVFDFQLCFIIFNSMVSYVIAIQMFVRGKGMVLLNLFQDVTIHLKVFLTSEYIQNVVGNILGRTLHHVHIKHIVFRRKNVSRRGQDEGSHRETDR